MIETFVRLVLAFWIAYCVLLALGLVMYYVADRFGVLDPPVIP